MVVVVRFWCWPAMVIVGERGVGEREGNGREKPKAMGFFFLSILLLTIIIIKKISSFRNFKIP